MYTNVHLSDTNIHICIIQTQDISSTSSSATAEAAKVKIKASSALAPDLWLDKRIHAQARFSSPSQRLDDALTSLDHLLTHDILHYDQVIHYILHNYDYSSLVLITD